MILTPLSIFFKAIISEPFGLIMIRKNCRIDPQLSKYNPQLLDYADKLTIREGKFVLWKGIVPVVLRQSILAFYSSQKKKLIFQSSKFLQWALYICQTIYDYGLYYLQVVVKADNITKCNSVLDIIKPTVQKKSNSWLNISLSFLLYIASKQLAKRLHSKLRAYLPMNIYTINLLLPTITLTTCFPIMTIINRMIANEMTIFEAISSDNLFAGYWVALWKTFI